MSVRTRGEVAFKMFKLADQAGKAPNSLTKAMLLRQQITLQWVMGIKSDREAFGK